ncbi:MAG: hypothetical protein MZV64_12815 [Ignavibacteriales bacterium]|nr:hypothetical protein [Ignavibacteriales bacterium]
MEELNDAIPRESRQGVDQDQGPKSEDRGDKIPVNAQQDGGQDTGQDDGSPLPAHRL